MIFRGLGFSGKNYLMDLYGTATAGYSLRRLRRNYRGPAITVRRSSDNALKDIYFKGENLDTTSLLNFVGTSGTDNGFVSVWYDQSGGGNDAIQGTALNQPKIVSAGTVIKENGLPCIEGDGSGRLQTSDIVLSSDLTMVAVASFDRAGDDSMVFGGTNPTTKAYFWRAGSSTIRIRNNNETGFGDFTVSFGTQDLFFARREGTIIGLSVNGTETTKTEAAVQGVDFTINLIGGGYTNQYDFDGTYQEIIFWNTSQSANRTAIEGNINGYYNIYTP